MSETEVNKEVELEEQKNVANKDAAPSEPTHLQNDAEDLGAPVVKPTDSNPDSTKKVKKITSDPAQKNEDEASLPKDNKPSGAAEEVESSDDEVIAEDSIDEVEIDLTDDVKALVSSDADLSEEFKQKAAIIFETAVKTRIKEQTKILESQYEDKLSKETDTVKEAMVEKVDSYLNYVVEEWMKENELAVERGIRTEIAEDFITGLKTLFKEHYIDVPEEKYNVLDDLTNEKDKLEDKLNEKIKENVELNKQVGEFNREKIIGEVGSDLADTELEKFTSMAANVEYDNAEKFKEKLETVKDSYFGKKTETKELLDDVAAGESSNEDLSKAMAAYSAAISKTKDIKLSIK